MLYILNIVLYNIIKQGERKTHKKGEPKITTCTIIDTNNGNEVIARDIELWGVTDALVNAFCGNSTPQEVYDTCCKLGDAICANEPTEAYEAYLGVVID